MEQPANKALRVGDWCVDPAAGQISRHGETARLEARTMRLLLCLADHPGQVVSIDDLLNEVWTGVIVTPDSVYQAVASLRRLLGDDPKQPAYIATVPRLGYRMIAAVGPWNNGAHPAPSTAAPSSPLPSHPAAPSRRTPPRTQWIAAAAFVILLGALFAAFLWRSRLPTTSHAGSVLLPAAPANSVAVLPFLDLTPGMQQEEFADGITEEMIDKLSRIPSLSVPSATASFYYKGRKLPVPEIARSLAVAYVLDGSVRKSGTWIRVDVRLVRAGNGYVVWSQTYDQPAKNMLMIQDDIAGSVAKALRTSIGNPSTP